MKKITFILVSLLLIVLDQITKFYFVSSYNYGAAFGILQGWKWFFIIISFLVLIIIYHYRKINGYGYIGLILLISGIIGNLIDRIYYGYVRDFIALGFFPSFNIADSYNTIGIFLLLIYLWVSE